MNIYKKTVFIAILGFCANLFLFILKITVGVISKSYAMIADAMNSGSDILNSVMMFIGGKVSQKKPCRRYPLGRGKAAYIFSVFMSITMIIISVFIFKSSLFSLFDSEHINFSYYIVFCCITNILIKFALYRYTRSAGKKYKSILIEVSSHDHRNDIFLAISTLIGGIFGYMGIWFVDGVVGICIALWIFFTGITLIYKSCTELMDCDDNDELRNYIKAILEKEKQIKKIDSIIILSASEKAEIRLSFSVEKNLTVADCHILKNDICNILSEDNRVGRILFQINPFKIN